MNRRDMFRGAAGGAAALALSGPQPQGHPGYPPPSLDFPQPDRAFNQIGIDPASEIRRLAAKKASEEKERLEMQIAQRIDALSDLKSISPAYRRYKRLELCREREAIQARFYEWIGNL